jgi:predicted amidophosphoribosyltransferase
MNSSPVVVLCPGCKKTLEVIVANPSTYHALRPVKCRFCGHAFDVEYWTQVLAVIRDESAVKEAA